MSARTCSNSNPRGSTKPEASPQNMNASSGSGLCPRRMSTASRLAPRLPLVSEEPTLELLQDLLAVERRHRLRAPVLRRDARVVRERSVRRFESVFELVPLEEIVHPPRLVARTVLRIDGPADGPDRRSVHTTIRSSAPFSSTP